MPQHRRPPPALEPERQRLRQLLRARTQLLELQQLETNWQEHARSAEFGGRPTTRQAARQATRELDNNPHLGGHSSLAPIQRLQQVQASARSPLDAWAEMPELGQTESGQPAALPAWLLIPPTSQKKRGHASPAKGRPQLLLLTL